MAAYVTELAFCSCVAARALVDFSDIRAQELALTGNRRNG